MGTLRVLSLRITPTLVLQVARSLEPEEEALDHLLAVLLLGGAAAVVIATIGGWFLAGKALSPVEEAFERQNVFVADASHELRTPLAVIRANAEFLQERQPASEEAAEIVSETDRLSSLVDSLLAVARGDGTGEAAHDELDLGAVVEGSAASMRLAGVRAGRRARRLGRTRAARSAEAASSSASLSSSWSTTRFATRPRVDMWTSTSPAGTARP